VLRYCRLPEGIRFIISMLLLTFCSIHAFELITIIINFVIFADGLSLKIIKHLHHISLK